MHSLAQTGCKGVIPTLTLMCSHVLVVQSLRSTGHLNLSLTSGGRWGTIEAEPHMTSAVSTRCFPSLSKVPTLLLPPKDCKEPFCSVGRCFPPIPGGSVPNCREDSSIWSNVSAGAAPEGQACPRGCRLQQKPRRALL